MHFLVTGAAGFIGSNVTEQLLADGHTVTGVDNLNDAYDVRLKTWRLRRMQGRVGFSFHKLDISDRAMLTGVLEGSGSFHAVINLAARAGVRQSMEDPWAYLDSNVTGTLNLLEWCRSHGVAKFILASSSSLYGLHNPMPYREDSDTNHPLSPYAASKKAAEALCHTYYHLYGISVTVLRYFTVYGPAGRPDMSAFRFVQWVAEGHPVMVFGDGRQRRDFTYVDDIARGTVAALNLPGFDVLNLGSDRPVEMLDVIRTVEKLLGQAAQVDWMPGHPTDVDATWANVTRAKEMLRWQPLTSFEQGMAQLVEWYRDNREWAREIDTGRTATRHRATGAGVRAGL